jgi:transcriptional regulator with XRE-family HTH domain
MEQAALASAANVSRNTIVDFEKSTRTPNTNNLAAIKAALEAAGVIFVSENGDGPGVRLRRESALSKQALEAAERMRSLLDQPSAYANPAGLAVQLRQELALVRPAFERARLREFSDLTESRIAELAKARSADAELQGRLHSAVYGLHMRAFELANPDAK